MALAVHRAACCLAHKRHLKPASSFSTTRRGAICLQATAAFCQPGHEDQHERERALESVNVRTPVHVRISSLCVDRKTFCMQGSMRPRAQASGGFAAGGASRPSAGRLSPLRMARHLLDHFHGVGISVAAVGQGGAQGHLLLEQVGAADAARGGRRLPDELWLLHHLARVHVAQPRGSVRGDGELVDGARPAAALGGAAGRGRADSQPALRRRRHLWHLALPDGRAAARRKGRRRRKPSRPALGSRKVACAQRMMRAGGRAAIGGGRRGGGRRSDADMLSLYCLR
eukprot:6201652-Pleurochrysis_carterae.AAC.2